MLKNKEILKKITIWILGQLQNIKLVNNLPDSLECMHCNLIIKQPWQSNDGKRYCEHCRIQLHLDNGFQDNFASIQIMKQLCYCCYDQCPWTGFIYQYEDHTTQCEYNDVAQCRYRKLGCQYYGNGGDLLQHNENSSMYHGTLVSSLLTYTPMKLEENFVVFQTVPVKLQHATEVIDELKNYFSANIVKDDLRDNEKKLKCISTYSEIKELLTKIADKREMIKSHLQDDIIPVSKEEFYAERKSFIEKKLSTLNDCVTSNETLMKQAEQNFNLYKGISFTGHALIKVDDIIDKVAGAQSAAPLRSSPIYTDLYGYKFCIEVHFHRAEKFNEPFISIYVIMLAGNYDEILPFPFPHSIAISIKRHNLTVGDKRRVLHPGEYPECFGRCLGGENQPIGFSRFIDHESLFKNGYVQDGSIFIEVLVLKGHSLTGKT